MYAWLNYHKYKDSFNLKCGNVGRCKPQNQNYTYSIFNNNLKQILSLKHATNVF